MILGSADWLQSYLPLRFERLFNRRSPYPYPRDSIWGLRHLHEPILAGRLRYRLHRIPQAIVAEALAANLRGSARESAAHETLKRIGRDWMWAEGAYDAENEVECLTGRADAYSESREWVLEVGSTEIGRLLKAMEFAGCYAEPMHRFTLLPFQPLRWADGSPRGVLAVDISCDADLCREMWDHHWAGMERAANSFKCQGRRRPASSNLGEVAR